MLSYHNDPAIKAKFVNRMKAHVAADELVRGVGWKSNGTIRGCAVGCTLDNYNHAEFEPELGIPEWVARLVDHLHESTPVDYRPRGVPFAQAFLEAVPVGKNLDPIKHHINIFIQRRNVKRVESLDIDALRKSQAITAINSVIDVHQKALDFSWNGSAARSTESASRSAAWSTESAARTASRSAARSATRSERSAARSAESQAIADEFLRLLRAA